MYRSKEEGGVMMGLGHTFLEHMVYQDGQLLNPGLIDYRIPTMEDLPEEFRSILVEDGDGPGPFGAKGIGESGLMPTAPAIANALVRAIGVRLKELPLTPERVRAAIAGAVTAVGQDVGRSWLLDQIRDQGQFHGRCLCLRWLGRCGGGGTPLGEARD
jgi:xanthine dehydrogenase molybdopterin-binding subunit B